MSNVFTYLAVRGGAGTIYTVTANKTLYLTNVWLNMTSYGSSIGNVYITVYDATPALVNYIGIFQLGIEQNTSLSLPIKPPLVLPAGYSVRLSTNISWLYANAGIIGYEI